MTRELIERALRRAFSLGQTFWQQADSESYSQNKKSFETEKKFSEHITETIDALLAAHLSAPTSQPDYFDGVDIPQLQDALTLLGCASDSHEAIAAASMSEHVNRITAAVLRCKDTCGSGG